MTLLRILECSVSASTDHARSQKGRVVEIGKLSPDQSVWKRYSDDFDYDYDDEEDAHF